jgi:L-glutamine-phosphate cytidylyltransferase
MTAIILAAGVGKRLHGASGGKPKCLIRIGGRSLLDRLLGQLARAGVPDAVVVVGFGADVVRAELGAGPGGIRVRFVDNPRFHEGAILSLWAAEAALSGPVLVMDADVLCSQSMIDRLVRSPHENCFLLDAHAANTGEEQMLLVRGERVLNIIRGGAPGYELMGESIGFLKLSGAAAQLLRQLLAVKIDAGLTGIEHEEVYPDLLTRVVVGFERVDGQPWTEIDFPDDVSRAEREILPRLGETA